MRQTQSSLEAVRSRGLKVDDAAGVGFPHVNYRIDGFNTAYNPLLKAVNGQRPVQTVLPVVFRSDVNPDISDGVLVEDLLAVCEDHLETKQQSLNGTDAHARASAYIRKAIEELIAAEKGKKKR